MRAWATIDTVSEPVLRLELAVQDAAGVRVAAAVGVDRLELCTALAVGGLTASMGLIERATAGPVPVHVLVRPHAGGFDYDAADADVIVTDVRRSVAAGAAGVVVGATNAGQVDEPLMRRIREAAGAAQVTFHRAFDVLAERSAVLDVLVGLDVDRVLTSGAAPSATAGVDELRRLVRHAAGRIEIMAAGGVTPAAVHDLARTGVSAVHASAKRSVADELAIELGTASRAAGRQVTDEALAGALVAAVRAQRPAATT